MIAESVLRGLAAIHAQKQLHRDIKPSNILLDCSARYAKIGDFGIAKELGSVSLAESFTGTLTYMSPERVAGEAYSYTSDIWSLGLCLIALADGRLPFPTADGYLAVVDAIQCQHTPLTLAPRTTEGDFAADGDAVSFWSTELLDFLSHCLDRDPKKRWLSAQLLEHPFLVKHRQRPLPESPPSKVTSTMMSSLREYAAKAADYYCLWSHDVPDMPEKKQVQALATQLNIPVDCVERAFREVWQQRFSGTRLDEEEDLDDASNASEYSGDEYEENFSQHRHLNYRSSVPTSAENSGSSSRGSGGSGRYSHDDRGEIPEDLQQGSRTRVCTAASKDSSASSLLSIEDTAAHVVNELLVGAATSAGLEDSISVTSSQCYSSASDDKSISSSPSPVIATAALEYVQQLNAHRERVK